MFNMNSWFNHNFSFSQYEENAVLIISNHLLIFHKSSTEQGCGISQSYKYLNTQNTQKLTKQANKLHGLSPRANYTDRATAACRRSECQLLRIKGATWSA
jgi:hypothetical protein